MCIQDQQKQRARDFADATAFELTGTHIPEPALLLQVEHVCKFDCLQHEADLRLARAFAAYSE